MVPILELLNKRSYFGSKQLTTVYVTAASYFRRVGVPHTSRPLLSLSPPRLTHRCFFVPPFLSRLSPPRAVRHISSLSPPSRFLIFLFARVSLSISCRLLDTSSPFPKFLLHLARLTWSTCTVTRIPTCHLSWETLLVCFVALFVSFHPPVFHWLGRFSIKRLSLFEWSRLIFNLSQFFWQKQIEEEKF